MTSTYLWLKFVHIAFVIIWVGGAVCLSILTARISRLKDYPALARYLHEAGVYAPIASGASSLLVLITGIAMLMTAHMSFGLPWITIGFVGMLVHFIVGAALIGRTAIAMEKAAVASDGAKVEALQRRLSGLQVIYEIVLAVVIWAMVFKPGS